MMQQDQRAYDLDHIDRIQSYPRYRPLEQAGQVDHRRVVEHLSLKHLVREDDESSRSYLHLRL
jgi:hypothetical protein